MSVFDMECPLCRENGQQGTIPSGKTRCSTCGTDFADPPPIPPEALAEGRTLAKHKKKYWLEKWRASLVADFRRMEFDRKLFTEKYNICDGTFYKLLQRWPEFGKGDSKGNPTKEELKTRRSSEIEEALQQLTRHNRQRQDYVRSRLDALSQELRKLEEEAVHLRAFDGWYHNLIAEENNVQTRRPQLTA